MILRIMQIGVGSVVVKIFVLYYYIENIVFKIVGEK